MICTNCHHRDVCDFAGKDSPILEYCCDREGGSWRFDRLRLGRMTTDRDALRAELDLVRGAIRADDERLYAAWVRIHGAPSDCANIGCDAPEWMADEILRLRAELDRTKGEVERARRNHLRRMEQCARMQPYPAPTARNYRKLARLGRLIASIRAALERKADA